MANILQNYVPTPQFYEADQAIQKEAVVDLLLHRLGNVDTVIALMKKAEAMALGGLNWKVCDTVCGPIMCRVLKRGEIHKDGSPMSDPVEPPPMIARTHANIKLWQKTTAEVNAERDLAARGGMLEQRDSMQHAGEDDVM